MTLKMHHIRLHVTGLKYPYKLSEDAKRQYKDYLNKNIIEIVRYGENEDYDGLNIIFSMEIT